jgi:hypothetical protein
VKTIIHLLAIVIFASLSAYADGGAVRLRQASGPFVVTLFSGSGPLRVGLIDASVLVQDRNTGNVVLDATVNLVFRPVASASRALLVSATRGQAKNKLLQAATVDVPAPGWWAIQIFVRRGGEASVFATQVLIMPAPPRLTTIWPFLILPPFAVGLFALHQTLGRSRLRISSVTPSSRHG